MEEKKWNKIIDIEFFDKLNRIVIGYDWELCDDVYEEYYHHRDCRTIYKRVKRKYLWDKLIYVCSVRLICNEFHYHNTFYCYGIKNLRVLNKMKEIANIMKEKYSKLILDFN